LLNVICLKVINQQQIIIVYYNSYSTYELQRKSKLLGLENILQTEMRHLIHQMLRLEFSMDTVPNTSTLYSYST